MLKRRREVLRLVIVMIAQFILVRSGLPMEFLCVSAAIFTLLSLATRKDRFREKKLRGRRFQIDRFLEFGSAFLLMLSMAVISTDMNWLTRGLTLVAILVETIRRVVLPKLNMK